MSRRGVVGVVDPVEAIGALALMLGWRGGVMPLWVDDGEGRPRRSYRECGAALGGWLGGAVRLHDGRSSRDVSVGLPEAKRDSLGASWSTVLWAWVQGKDQVWRASRFRPLPSMVLRVDGSSRRLLLWWLREAVPFEAIAPANRRIAYALHAKQKDGVPGDLRIPLPGSFLRVGRVRPALVVCTRLEVDTFTRDQVVGRLRDPPDPDAWRERRR